jgi:hypothetical protein
MSDRVEATCPCCRTLLTVDTATGEILAEERPKADHSKSFDDAMTQVRGGAQHREQVFDKAFSKTKHLDEILEKKFEEAQKKASKDKSKLKNPFDLD